MTATYNGTCFGLLKFGKEYYLNKLLDGEVYFSLSNEFRTSNNVSSDKFENLLSYMTSGTFSFGDKTFNFIEAYQLNDVSLPILSLYALRTSIADVDSRMWNFGDGHAVFIHDCVAFLTRLRNKILDLDLGCQFCFQDVEYCNLEKIERNKLNIFKKSIDFSWQREYRVCLYTNSIFPIVINIGKIRDIAYIIRKEQ